MSRRLEGKIVASNTQSRAATIDVDVDGDGKADLRAQIGPAMRGTALRDALDFVDFNSFKNQIDFAQFGKSFNTYVERDRAFEAAARRARRQDCQAARRLCAGFGLGPAADDAGRSRIRAGAMTNAAHDVILKLEDVSKVYFGTVAVKRANFEVRRGAVNVLVGENGAGKSTLMKIIAGVEKPTHGRILLEGEEVSFASSGDAVERGIGMVFQELNLFGNLTVAENIFTTRELTNRVFHIDHKEQERRAGEFLDRLKAGIRPDMLVEDLRIGQQQLVEIAKAVSLDARILIMDEPTSALSAAEVEVLFKVIADLKRQGVAIVYISHRLEELIRIGDYITVLRDGHITGQEEMKNVDTQWIVRQMIGSDAKDFAKADDHKPGEEVLRAEEICLPRATGGLAVDHVSLSLRAGEILGIYGLMGAGRSELFDCIMGRHGQATGKIFIDGEEVSERDTDAAHPPRARADPRRPPARRAGARSSRSPAI